MTYELHAEEWGKLLVKHGFINKKHNHLYRKKDDRTYELKEGGGQKSDHAYMEIAEEVNIQAFFNPKFSSYQPTGYPECHKRYRLVVESATSKLSLEETYFWLLNFLRTDASFPYIEKITDIFSASEQSAFWGAAQSRLSIQQDRASQFFKGMSEMVKQLFQLVRELRVLDEKLEPRKNWGEVKAADVALKGEYTDLVENKGGQVAPGSVYHLSQQVGYAILPDLFFNTHIYKIEDIDEKIGSLKYNKNVKNVLKRKIYAFVNWKLKTDKELESRRMFTLRYLRQHWNVIKMYMSWVKPYLRNIARMQMSQEHIQSPDIVSAFETSMIEVELLAHKESQTSYRPCIILTFRYRTRPEMSFQQDNYAHRGPTHVGKVEVDFRSYGWTKEQVDAYKKMKREEDMMLLGMVDESVKAAMDALGEELEKYLWESGEKEFEEKRKMKLVEEKKRKGELMKQAGLSAGALEPFVAVFKGFAEIGSILLPAGSGKKSPKVKINGKANQAEKSAASDMYNLFKNYKKAHGMLSW